MNDESKILKVLRSEAGIVVSIVTILVGIMVPYFNIVNDISLIQKDIAIINTNHEAHIQDILQSIKEMNAKNAEQDRDIQNSREALIKLLK